jgi:CSLREA domain-containing protein
MKTFINLIVFLLVLSAAAEGATITVTQADDNNDGICNAVCTLREAIQAAGPSDEVVFSSLFNTPQIIDLTGGHITTNGITITGPGSNLLTVRSVIGQGPISRIFNFNGSINLSGMTITGGNVNGAGGGGIAIGSGTAVLNDVVVTGNTAAGGVTAYSGGITMSGGLLIMNNCTVSNNTTSSPFEDTGGGIRVFGGELQMTNSTVSGNRSTLGNFNGGGIYLHGPGTITNSTITDNETVGTQRGSGIYNAGFDDIVLNNSIVAGNRNNTVHPDVTGQFASTSSYNLIGNVGAATGLTVGNQNQLGSAGTPIDPNLSTLGNHGGNSPTHSPNIGSPAIDKGNSPVLLTDQRGFARRIDLAPANASGGDASDIGAVEAQAPTAAHVSVSGRVLDANKRPLANAQVTMSGQDGAARIARTSPFGYFIFDDVASGETYFVDVRDKRFQFATQVITVSGDLTDVDFIAVNGKRMDTLRQ